MTTRKQYTTSSFLLGGAILLAQLLTLVPTAESQCPSRTRAEGCASQRALTESGTCEMKCAHAASRCPALPADPQEAVVLPASPSRAVVFSYAFDVLDPDPAAGKIEAWIPVPHNGSYQRLDGWHLETPWPHELVEDEEYGNRFLKLDLSDRAQWRDGQIPVSLSFTVTRWAQRSDERTTGAVISPGPSDSPQRFLRPNRLVPVDGEVAREALRVAGTGSSPLQRARLLYDHLIATLDYDKTGTGWGRGDALYACDVRKGNCTDFHSLFIGEARSLDIPARFVIGFPLPGEASAGEISGYHCWAEFHDESRGWLPIDASEAHQHPEKAEQLFAGVDEHRIAFTIGRDIVLPGSAGAPLNYSIYPHIEIDGREHRQITKRFSFRDQNNRGENRAQLSSVTGS